jgi:hypothetical protein
MNERIKELMKEANKDITLGKPFWPALEEFSEKFARLIVAECALLCVSRPGPGDDISSREHCSEQILQHFGVEK